MGQKVNPIGLRLGINRNWESRWFPSFDKMPTNVAEDDKIRKFVKKELYYAGVAQTIVERTAKKVRVTIVAARPGIIIGKKGADVEKLKASLSKLVGKEIAVNIKEERKPQISGQLAAENVAQQLERRVAFRRAMKRVMQNALKSGAKGIKVSVSGRLGGAEMARTEWYLEGRVPLHTLRARIDYGFAEAHTTYGCIGIKVWIFKGEVLAKGIPTEKAETSKPKRRPSKRRGK
ncbi:30S ribosomal protein S3 [Malaciobacter molluscorum LMG 25693]|uniref:Small ribosomal subunit protein uS3 n=1 Tax=Malaciobacter molluscorum LMG 25693 TaxID=870501 RepID=A0A2G1DIJ6_9BACT|nr:30S ribosomal protein S3 [Malaciobacter molluscorum]AXX91835.1 30S ribosomal protein S3 [Malaciobacter molluscorum LMG 25693]PHO18244.1 30S ribosomal protein S3 [Malaciobacter molluscorum LMG 25693]RXJ94127.1 30S ribosomal protein S3 [Malaciobacter molluscorum]